jgi:hypothetical protein
MDGPNSLNDARSASPLSHAQAAAVSHESILCEASSASSLATNGQGAKAKMKK